MSSGMKCEFMQLNETRRRIYETIEFLNDVSFPTRMRRLLLLFETAIRESFESARHCPLRSRKLARTLSGLTEIIHIMSSSLRNDRKYCESLCNIVGYYIACELCAAQEPVESEALIVERIKMVIKTYVKQNTEHLLRTFVAIPKLFYRSDIVTELNTTFLFTQWQKDTVVQAELSDKIYIQYVLIFYQWQSATCDEAKREEIMEFADQFMRPSSSLASNEIYNEYLPKYIARSSATRYILEHLKQTTSGNLFVASKVDNCIPQSRREILFLDNEENNPQLPAKRCCLAKLSKDTQEEVSFSSDPPASSTNTEEDRVPIASSYSNYALAISTNNNQLNKYVQTGEEMDLDDLSICVLYSDTQFPGTGYTNHLLIYPAMSNFQSTSSSESGAKVDSGLPHQISNSSTHNVVKGTPSSSSRETLRWQACKRILLSTDPTFSPSVPIETTENAETVALTNLEIKARSYQFKRQKFVKLGKAYKKFYKDLLVIQRKNLRNLQEEQQLHLIRQATKRSQQLRALNDKRRCEAEQLEHHLTVIRNS